MSELGQTGSSSSSNFLTTAFFPLKCPKDEHLPFETVERSVEDGEAQAEYQPPAPKRAARDWRKANRHRKFNSEWKHRYFVVPVEGDENKVQCLLCNTFLQLKSDNIKKHAFRYHRETVEMSDVPRVSLADHLIVQRMQQEYQEPQGIPEMSVSDPQNYVFANMGNGGRMMVRRLEDIERYLREKELKEKVDLSPYLSIQVDDSLEGAIHEQCLVFLRLMDLNTLQVETHFLAMAYILGAPNAENIFSQLNEIVVQMGIPVEKIVGFITDSAGIMPGRHSSVGSRVTTSWNKNAFVQHCIVHKEILCTRKASQELPHFMEETTADILNYFKYSAKKNNRFAMLTDLIAPHKVVAQLIRYNKVQCLSLRKCVERIWDLSDELVQFFTEESKDTSNNLSQRDTAQGILDSMKSPSFKMYLAFLVDVLPVLDKINQQLKENHQNVYQMYQVISLFMKAFSSYVIDDRGEVVPLDNIVFPGTHYNQILQQCKDSELSSEERTQIKQNCQRYMMSILDNFHELFPHMEVVLTLFSFVDPRLRLAKRVDPSALIQMFPGASLPNLELEYARYRYDENISILYSECSGNLIRFWDSMHKRGYPELANLAFAIMVMTPDVLICERAFSLMKHINTDKHSALSQLQLSCALRLGLDSREPEQFPFDQLLTFLAQKSGDSATETWRRSF
ncbi:protein FAM200A isoform X2 [Latimeria chalumnae]|uniref:protein FAM200A isoform X2 n=1 Tax=Latimeria chalumnae TaxID=7897 RepID=UPI0003C1B45F|nr:PREDICTED: protein FAM200A-like isoform X2 [Latimeria chalumnae]|eukprot:XP_005990211.1 PREDICTED: protein FAM200A-like isoform X2 [Latimeria chalumnae]